MRFLLSSLLAAMVCLCACGAPGAPQAPSLDLPKPVTDLQAVRKGSGVTLTWTAPTETTDGELIRKGGKMVVARGTRPDKPFQAVAEVALEPSVKAVERPRVLASDDIAQLLSDPALPDFILYHVTSVSHRGRSSEASSNIRVPAVITPLPPRTLTLGLVQGGVTISFDLPAAQQPSSTRLNSQYLYRILRRPSNSQPGTEPAVVSQVRPGEPAMPVVDTRIEWEKKYDYWVTPITRWSTSSEKGEVEGDDSPAATILAHDSFPPATPSGLQAVFSGLVDHPAVDLTWSPGTDDDLAGYNVYRRTADSQPEKINLELVKTPAFHDAKVTLGARYWYSATAVDLRGNESQKSAEATEVVPKQ